MRLNYCVRLNTYCSAGVKKGLLVFGCEFVHLIPTRRKNAISMLSALSNTLPAFGRFGSRDFDRRGFNARPLEQPLRTAENRDSRSTEASPLSVRSRLLAMGLY